MAIAANQAISTLKITDPPSASTNLPNRPTASTASTASTANPTRQMLRGMSATLTASRSSASIAACGFAVLPAAVGGVAVVPGVATGPAPVADPVMASVVISASRLFPQANGLRPTTR